MKRFTTLASATVCCGFLCTTMTACAEDAVPSLKPGQVDRRALKEGLDLAFLPTSSGLRARVVIPLAEPVAATALENLQDELFPAISLELDQAQAPMVMGPMLELWAISQTRYEIEAVYNVPTSDVPKTRGGTLRVAPNLWVTALDATPFEIAQ